MKIVAGYDFNGGRDFIKKNYGAELQEICSVIKSVDANRYKQKSNEKRMAGRTIYSPTELNKRFKMLFHDRKWASKRVNCEYKYGKHLKGYIPSGKKLSTPFREIDFVKPQKKIGVEVQLGKYAFMPYDVFAKMPIFRNLNIIDAGIEIVPVKNFVDEMSSGISYFEQFAWDLEMRGISNIDIPVLILGIDA